MQVLGHQEIIYYSYLTLVQSKRLKLFAILKSQD